MTQEEYKKAKLKEFRKKLKNGDFTIDGFPNAEAVHFFIHSTIDEIFGRIKFKKVALKR